MGAPAIDAGRDFSAREEHGRLIFEDARGLLDLPLPRLPGRHQQQNAATAIAALRCVEPDLEPTGFRARPDAGRLAGAAAKSASRAVSATSRRRGAEIWLDGGHNEDGGRALAEAMADFEDKTRAPAGHHLRHADDEGHRRVSASLQGPRAGGRLPSRSRRSNITASRRGTSPPPPKPRGSRPPPAKAPKRRCASSPRANGGCRRASSSPAASTSPARCWR